VQTVWHRRVLKDNTNITVHAQVHERKQELLVSSSMTFVKTPWSARNAGNMPLPLAAKNSSTYVRTNLSLIV
jgi:hypothetical protein